MKKITFLGNFNVDFTSESHHAKTLESLGYEVIKMQEGSARAESVLREAMKSDLFIWVHTHGWKTRGMNMADVLNKLNNKGIPTITYHLDLWFGLRRQTDLKKDPVYTNIGHFFTVDKQMSDWFNKNTKVKGHYIPAGVFDQECYYKKQKLTHDIIFVGSKKYHAEWPYRPKLIKWLGSTYENSFEHWGGDGIGIKRGAELNKLYSSTKIVVGDTLCPNFNYSHYWSDRVYETMGRGGFIIHPYINGMEKEFEDKKHLVFYEYNNFSQLKDLIDYYLEHDEEREKIRLAGHKLVKEKYTYKNRWEQIFSELNI